MSADFWQRWTLRIELAKWLRFRANTRSITSLRASGVAEPVLPRTPSKLAYSVPKLTDRNVTKLISSNLELHSLSQGRPARVVTAMTMLKQYLYRYQGHIGAYLVVGGVDATGPQLFTVHAHGSTDKLPYVTMGSGSLAAMAIFESAYKENMTRKEAIDLVARAIRSGVFNDLGSGSNVDVCVITKSGTETLRNYEKPVSTSAK